MCPPEERPRFAAELASGRQLMLHESAEVIPPVASARGSVRPSTLSTLARTSGSAEAWGQFVAVTAHSAGPHEDEPHWHNHWRRPEVTRPALRAWNFPPARHQTTWASDDGAHLRAVQIGMDRLLGSIVLCSVLARMVAAPFPERAKQSARRPRRSICTTRTCLCPMPILLPSIAQDTMAKSSIAVIPSGDAPPATCTKKGRAWGVLVFAVRSTHRPVN